MGEQLTLGDVCTAIVDTKHKTPKFTASGYPCIRTPNIDRGFFTSDKMKYVDQKSYDEWTERVIPTVDDLIFAREAPVGNVAIIPKGFKVCHGQRTVLIRPNKEVIESRYLMYLMLGDEVQALIHSMASGATVPHLNMSDIRSLKLPKLPNRQAQIRISHLLANYDNLIENNNRRITILEDMAQSLYREWFVKFRYPGHEQCQMAESPLGLIPEGWAVEALKEVCQLTMGQSPKSEFYNQVGDGLPFYQGVKDYGKRFPSVSVWCSKPTRIAAIGDILFSVRAPVGRLNIANSQMAIGRGLSAIRHKNGYQSFLFQQLKSIFSREDLIGNGAIFNAVTKKDMEQIQLICPPDSVLKMVAEVLDPIFRQLEVLCIKNDNLKAQRDLLLPKLISGQIDLSLAEQVSA